MFPVECLFWYLKTCMPTSRVHPSLREGHLHIFDRIWLGFNKHCCLCWPTTTPMTKLISLTFNPKWVEVEEELQRTGQILAGHIIPDNVVATVFDQKLRQLLINLVTHTLMGRVTTYRYNIELQRRGCPHAFIFLTMHCPLISRNEVIYLYDWDKGMWGGDDYTPSTSIVWRIFQFDEHTQFMIDFSMAAHINKYDDHSLSNVVL
jgi:hypothetical protein